MFCKNCGSRIEENAKFCVSCGAAVNVPSVDETPEEAVCGNCGVPLKEGANFCAACGTAVSAFIAPGELSKESTPSPQQPVYQVPPVPQSVPKQSALVNDDGVVLTNETFKLTDYWIKKLISKNLGDDESDFCYFFGVTNDGLVLRLLVHPFIRVFFQKRYILNITKKGIHMHRLTMRNKPESYFFIPTAQINSFKISDGLFGQKKILIEYFGEQKMILFALKRTKKIVEQERNLFEIETTYSK